MKKIFQYSILAAGVMLGMTSCEDMFGSYLDKEPSNELTEEQVYSSWTTAVQSHVDTYNFLRHGSQRIGNSWLDAATDLAETSYATAGVRTSFNIGNYYGTGGAAELTSTWEHYYRAIRKCNQTISKLPNVPKNADLSDTDYANQQRWYNAEARFLRAYFYWELFLRYGPVPVITEVLDPNDQQKLLSFTDRPTVKEYVVDFVMKELADVESKLLTYDEAKEGEFIGHVSAPMASALYGRIAMFMASPRYAQESGLSWKDALAANDSFMSKYAANYGLITTDATFPTPVDALTAVWNTVQHEGNREAIFFRNDAQHVWGNISNDVNVGDGGNGGCCPSQNLVDMYDMADGSAPFVGYDVTGAPLYNGMTPTVNAASNYSDATMWQNRDPRFNAAVLYHNVSWNGNNINVIIGQRDNPVGNANATPTGYYMRKWVPISIFANSHGGNGYRIWNIIRYAEILMNRAEILNEVNYEANKTEIVQYLDMVRSRAGITSSVSDRNDITDQKTMRNFIHKERTVEFAFEEHRWWDVRRWNCAKEALGRKIFGVTVDTNGNISRKVAQERVFDDKMYLYPIPETEYWKTGIANNPGWE